MQKHLVQEQTDFLYALKNPLGAHHIINRGGQEGLDQIVSAALSWVRSLELVSLTIGSPSLGICPRLTKRMPRCAANGARIFFLAMAARMASACATPPFVRGPKPKKGKKQKSLRERIKDESTHIIALVRRHVWYAKKLTKSSLLNFLYLFLNTNVYKKLLLPVNTLDMAIQQSNP